MAACATASSTGPTPSRAARGSPARAPSATACPSPPTSSTGWCSRLPAHPAPPPSRPVAGERRVAVTVAGLGSTSGSAAIDDLRTSDLGYDEGAGGPLQLRRRAHARIRHGAARSRHVRRTRRATRRGTRSPPALASPTWSSRWPTPTRSARVDVYAHSLGGLVTRLALAELEARGFDLARLGLVATIASPHGGADLATAVAAAADAPRAGPVLDAAADVLGLGLDPDAPVVAQLSERSSLVDGLARAGVPGGVRFLSIAARGDLVVASPHTDVDGATEVTVPVAGLAAHSTVVGSDGGDGRDRPRPRGPAPGLRGMGRRRGRRPDRPRHLGVRGPRRPRAAGGGVTRRGAPDRTCGVHRPRR